jgi:hypothetical protein
MGRQALDVTASVTAGFGCMLVPLFVAQLATNFRIFSRLFLLGFSMRGLLRSRILGGRSPGVNAREAAALIDRDLCAIIAGYASRSVGTIREFLRGVYES